MHSSTPQNSTVADAFSPLADHEPRSLPSDVSQRKAPLIQMPLLRLPELNHVSDACEKLPSNPSCEALSSSTSGGLAESLPSLGTEGGTPSDLEATLVCQSEATMTPPWPMSALGSTPMSPYREVFRMGRPVEDETSVIASVEKVFLNPLPLSRVQTSVSQKVPSSTATSFQQGQQHNFSSGRRTVGVPYSSSTVTPNLLAKTIRPRQTTGLVFRREETEPPSMHSCYHVELDEQQLHHASSMPPPSGGEYLYRVPAEIQNQGVSSHHVSSCSRPNSPYLSMYRDDLNVEVAESWQLARSGSCFSIHRLPQQQQTHQNLPHAQAYQQQAPLHPRQHHVHPVHVQMHEARRVPLVISQPSTGSMSQAAFYTANRPQLSKHASTSTLPASRPTLHLTNTSSLHPQYQATSSPLMTSRPLYPTSSSPSTSSVPVQVLPRTSSSMHLGQIQHVDRPLSPQRTDSFAVLPSTPPLTARAIQGIMKQRALQPNVDLGYYR